MLGLELKSADAPEFALTIIVCIASFALFVVHPLHVAYQLWKKEVEDFYLYTYVAGFFHNGIMSFYIISILNQLGRDELCLMCLLISTNISFLIEATCLMTILSLPDKKENPKNMFVGLSLLGCCVLLLILIPFNYKYKYAGNIAVFMSIISGTFLYMSPIYILEPEKSKTMLSQLGCGFLFGLSFCILACVSSYLDLYIIAITNGIGVLIQLILFISTFRPRHAVVERVKLFISEAWRTLLAC